MDLLRYTLKVTFRRKLLLIAYIVMFLAVHVANIDMLQTEGLDGYYWYLFRIQDFGLYGFVFYGFFAYEYFGYAEQVSLTETISMYHPYGTLSRVWQLVILMASILILTLVNAGYQVVAFFLAGMDHLPLLAHALEAVLLNFTMPMILAALIGMSVSFCPNRTAAYGIITASVILVSPLLDNVLQVLNWYVDIYSIRDSIAIVTSPVAWIPDTVYGLTLEDYRWNIVLFWCCLLGGFLVCQLWGRRRRLALVLCAVMLVCAAAQFHGFLGQFDRDSVIHLDHRKTSTLSGDSNYWDEQGHESKSEEASFAVLSYDMMLEADRYLYANVTVAVTPSTDGDIYKFTLWYGYEIDSVTDGEGNALPFARNGIYVEVTYDCPEPAGKICFRYSGNGNQYYSNNQGIALPGYIPYYPMAGFLDMWDDEQGAVIVHTDFPEKVFTVTMNTDLPLITNLEQTGTNTYSGTTETVSIFGGFLKAVEEDGYTYMQLLLDPQDADFATVDVEIPIDLSNMVIMLYPKYLGLASGSLNEKYVIFEDHIIVSSYSTSILSRVLSEVYESEHAQ